MPSAHAKLSPSASSRWIACPASIQMSQGIPDKESPAAREGTTAHALAEIEVRAAFNQLSGDDYSTARQAWHDEAVADGYSHDTITEMEVHVADFVDFVVRRSHAYVDTVVFAERRVDTGVPQSWGTSDVILVSPEHVEIIDLKYGKGVAVEATGNPQLRLYACGALDEYGGLLGDVRDIYATVVQPRLDSISTEYLTADQLRFWRDEIAIPAAREALGDNPRFGPSESACRFCPAAGICRARADYVTAEEFGGDPETLTPKEIGDWLHRFKDIRAWMAAVEAEALDALYERGEEIPGWKAVLSGGQRKITKPDEAITTLEDYGYRREDIVTEKIAGFGVLDKLVGKDELLDILGPLLVKSPGRPSLAPTEDGRKPVTKTENLLDEFD